MSSILKVDTIQNTGGTTGLTIDSSGFLKGAKESLFRAYQSSSQTIPNYTTTTIAYDAESFDPNSWYDTSTYKFTPTLAGYYSVTASLRYNTDTDFDICDLYLYKNTTLASSASDAHRRYDTLNLNDIIYLNGSSDYLICKTLQASGSSLTLRNYTSETFFCAHRLAT
tara:strand:+ start:465 stop:968 length:504 start_codon:yes stop_codon:yes gene_type:complete